VALPPAPSGRHKGFPCVFSSEKKMLAGKVMIATGAYSWRSYPRQTR